MIRVVKKKKKKKKELQTSLRTHVYWKIDTNGYRG